MAFCNSCGANLTAGTRFCSKCGAAIVASSLPPLVAEASPTTPSPVPVPAPPQPSGGGALKAILIVVGALVLLGILGAASVGFFAWRWAHHSHIRQEGDNLKVETPFGAVESTKDPEEAARNLGIDLYPGAQVLKDGATSARIGSVHTSALNFETSDSPDKVCSFYKERFPNATVMTSQSDQCMIMSSDKKNMISINIKAEDGKTRIMISNVTHRPDSAGSSN